MFFKKYKQVISMALASTLLLTGCSAASQEVASGETSTTTGVARKKVTRTKQNRLSFDMVLMLQVRKTLITKTL